MVVRDLDQAGHDAVWAPLQCVFIGRGLTYNSRAPARSIADFEDGRRLQNGSAEAASSGEDVLITGAAPAKADFCRRCLTAGLSPCFNRCLQGSRPDFSGS